MLEKETVLFFERTVPLMHIKRTVPSIQLQIITKRIFKNPSKRFKFGLNVAKFPVVVVFYGKNIICPFNKACFGWNKEKFIGRNPQKT
jgi:hypothetical protein